MKKVEFIVRGNLMWIRPAMAILHVLEKETTFSRKEQGQRGVDIVNHTLGEYIKKHDAYETLSGLRAKLEKALHARGYSITLTYKDRKEHEFNVDALQEDDLANLAGRDDQVTVLGLIHDHPEGFVIKAPTGWGKSFVIAQACQILPKARIAVVAPGKEIAKTLYSRIKKRIREVGFVGDGSNFVSRVTVCTTQSIHKISKEEWDFLFFDEVHKAAAPETSRSLAEAFHRAKCIGFSASPTGRSDGADMLTEALFGPVIYSVTYQEGVDNGSVVPIDVEMYNVDHGPNTGVTGVMLNKIGLWGNHTRNNLIREIAEGLPEDDQVLIMVATAEHALRLKALLPDYEVVLSNISPKLQKQIQRGNLPKIPGIYNGTMTPQQRAKLKAAFEAGTLKRAIATSIWNTGVDFTQLAYLIRADGQSSDILSTQTPGRLSRTADGKKKGVLIDFLDNFNETLRGRSMRRKKHYLGHGWKVNAKYHPSMVPTLRTPR